MGGPGPPSEGQDKQLICNSGGDETSMGEPGGQQDGPDATSRTYHAQSMYSGRENYSSRRRKLPFFDDA